MAAPWSIETLGEAILNLSGQIDLPITLETSHYLFNIDMIGLYIFRIPLLSIPISDWFRAAHMTYHNFTVRL